ncbi:MAG TPA: hypothetical protein VFV50_12575 [Bdellovibrionales bacterium]|nr:hypothetical protein [Bdellovibrionales bacterium]
MKNLKFIIIAAALALTSACGHQKIKYEGGGLASNEKEGRGIQAQVIWLKRKKDAIDILMTLQNKYEQNVAFKRSGITLTLNGQQLMLRDAQFTGDMEPNQLEKGLLLFASAAGELPETGVAQLKIDKIVAVSQDEKKTETKLPPLVMELEVRK